MKTTLAALCSALVALASMTTSRSQTVSWTGAGSGPSWDEAANWSGGTVPGQAHDVLITGGLGTDVVISGNVMIKSLQCNKGLTLVGGSLTLTAGSSLISGPLSMGGTASLTVNNNLASLGISGSITVSNAGFYARSGAVLQILGGPFSTIGAEPMTWMADGAGSKIDLSRVTNLVISGYPHISAVAYSGGTVDLRGLNSAPFGFEANAAGPGSRIDLSGMSGRWASQGSDPLTLSAWDGASLYLPNVTELEHAQLTVQSTGFVSTAQLVLLTNVTLTADGATPNFGKLTNIDDSSVYALNGGQVLLPNVTRVVVGVTTPVWQVDAPGSRIDLSRLTNLVMGPYQGLYVAANNSGAVDLKGLKSAPSAVTVTARGVGSSIDLSGMSGRWRSEAPAPLGIYAQDGAVVDISNVTQLEHAGLTIQSPGTVPTAQLNLLTNVTLTIDGAEPNLGGLTNIDDTTVAVLDGGVARLTNITRVSIGAYDPIWQSSGMKSLIDLSGVVELAAPNDRQISVRVFEGGKVDLRRLRSAPLAVNVEAQGSGSLVDLSGLQGRWSSFGSLPLELASRNGATVLIPNVTQIEHGNLTVESDGVISTAQLNLLTNSSLTVDGTAPELGRLVNIDDCSVYVANGGVARLTNVSQVVVGSAEPTWRAMGAGSLLDLSRLTVLKEGYYQRVGVQAFGGGLVDLRSLKTGTWALSVYAQDPGSVVDLTGLAGGWSSQGNLPLELISQNGAAVLFPNVTQIEHGALTIQSNGILSSAQLTILTNSMLTVDGASPDFGRLTNIDDTSVYALNGGVAALTNVTSVVVGSVTPTWLASGTGSVVNLSMLTNLSLGFYQSVYIDVYQAGTVDLRGLRSTSGTVSIEAQDTGSLVDLSSLTGRWSSGSGPLQVACSDGASVLIPNVNQIENGWLRIKNDGIVSTAQLNLLTNVLLTLDGAAPDFGALTNMDDCSVYALNGGVARLTNVTQLVAGSVNPFWFADGMGSLVDLSRLTDLRQRDSQVVFLRASSGGEVDVGRLGSSYSGALQILADGLSSTVDLTGLSSLVSLGNSFSSLIATNGGAILVNDQALLLANTMVSVPAGNTILPPALDATNALTLCGKSWHSYWMERRDPTHDGSPWVFVMRVPLTNSAQILNFKPTVNTALRVWDFVADRPIVDLSVSPEAQQQLCLYGAINKTYQVLTTPDLTPGVAWQPVGTAAMTNAFQIFWPGPVSAPARFYRAKQL